MLQLVSLFMIFQTSRNHNNHNSTATSQFLCKHTRRPGIRLFRMVLLVAVQYKMQKLQAALFILAFLMCTEAFL